jgi:hypothetical protein
MRLKWMISGFLCALTLNSYADVSGAANSAVTSPAKIIGAESEGRIDPKSIVISDEIKALPNARGESDLYDLHQAMALDNELKTRLIELIGVTDRAKRSELLDEFIYRWTGADRVELKQMYAINSRQVAALEMIVGDKYDKKFFAPDKIESVSKLLLRQYNEFKVFTDAQILVQTEYKPELSDIVLPPFDSSVIIMDIRYKMLLQRLPQLYLAGERQRLTDLTEALWNLTQFSRRDRLSMVSVCLVVVEDKDRNKTPDIADYIYPDCLNYSEEE